MSHPDKHKKNEKKIIILLSALLKYWILLIFKTPRFFSLFISSFNLYHKVTENSEKSTICKYRSSEFYM